MPVTLAHARNLTQDKLARIVIDEFRKSSQFMDTLVFDDNVSIGGGSTLKYVYNRVTTYGSAAFREINTEYVPQEAVITPYTVELKPFGGAFEIDRVIQRDVRGVTNQLELQLNQKIQAAVALYCDTFINGDTDVDDKAFDGLDKALADSSTEFSTETAIDLSDSKAIDDNYKVFLDNLNFMLSLLDGDPSNLLVNKRMKAVMDNIAFRSKQFTSEDTDAFGRRVLKYAGIPIQVMGDKPGSSNPIVPIDSTDGTTSIYACRVGLDGVHGITPDGSNMITTYLPNFESAGAVKKGEVEMVSAMALKATRAAGVLRNIKLTNGSGISA